MKITKAIVATDNNPLYTECWPLITKGWKNIGNIETVAAVIGECNIDNKLGHIINFEPIEGISNAFISQVIRFIIPAFFPEEICITSDIDMLALSKKYFVDDLEKYSENSILILTADAYGLDDKFPMCYFVAKGKTFQKLIGLDNTNNETIIAFIKKLFSLNLGWNTDESFLGKCIKNNINNFEIHFLERCRFFPFKTTRIDRSFWKVNKIKLLKNLYIDSHLVRPISKYKKEIEFLETYIFHKNNGFTTLKYFYKRKVIKVFNTFLKF